MEILSKDYGYELRYQDLSFTVKKIEKDNVILESYDGEKITQKIESQEGFGRYFLFPQTSIKVKIIPSEEL